MFGFWAPTGIQRVGLQDLTSMTERTNPVRAILSLSSSFFAAMVVVAAASRHFWISRL
jgi:hypothetical protein